MFTFLLSPLEPRQMDCACNRLWGTTIHFVSGLRAFADQVTGFACWRNPVQDLWDAEFVAL